MAAVYQDSRPPIPTPPPPPPFMHNHIDLTGDDDGEIDSAAHPERDFGRSAKRPRMEGSFTPSSSQESQLAPRFGPRRQVGAFHSGPSFPGGPGSMSHLPISNHAQAFPGYRPAFAGPSSATQFGLRQGQQIQPPQHRLQQQQAPVQPPSLPQTDSKQVIDLTSSPSPPPERRRSEAPGSNPCPLPADLPPKTPVCIGQLGVTALIFDPSPYTASNDPHFDEWLPVRLQYENNPNKSPNIADTIHIKPPSHRTLDGQHDSGSFFAFVEQKVATALGPMLGKGLIRLDAKIKKGRANSPILPLQMLVYTPKGNIPVVGNFLQQCHLLLDHPSRHIFDEKILNHYHYWNPHNPPPGGHAARQAQRDMRWTATTNPGKSIEVQRSQVDELFKNLKDGDELPETEPSRDVATRLYPHQKKALTFLLEREREHCIGDVHSSLWQRRANPITRRISWFHIVTQQEVFEQPQEAKGAILADDMGLGKTITCVSLIAATLASARAFASEPIDPIPSLPSADDGIDAAHFAGSVWGMPDVHEPSTSKAKAAKLQDKLEADYVRMSRVKAKSRGTLIICPLSTVVNWEDQFREHWRGEVTVVGGNGQCLQQAGCQAAAAAAASQPPNAESQSTSAEAPPVRIRDGTPLRIYIYHGNARRPDPTFLADFDAVITTYATLASEFSKQTKSTAADEEEDESSDMGITEVDERGHPVIKIGKAKKGKKRKKTSAISNLANEVPSPLQSIHWFRVVLDEAHSIKEISTVGSRASCDLMADRRLCLTGTPVQNKLDDVFALIKFLRLAPFDEKNVWTEYVGSPVKFGQALGIARLQSIMKCITLRRTKESKTADGKRILSLPPRADELRMLKFEPHEQEIYDRFFNESKAEFNDLSNKNEIMKNYVGILQKILRLRQICDHFELVEGKELNRTSDSTPKYEDVVAAVMNEGFTKERAHCIFSILREAASTQCVECTAELSPPTEGECPEGEAATTSKRGRKPKASQKVDASSSRNATRASSPAVPRVVLTKCQHLFCIECYRNSVCPGWPAADPNAGRSCSVCQTGLKPADAIEIKCDPEVGKKKPQKREKRQKGVGLENFRPSTKVRTLVNDLAQFSRLNPHSSNYDNEIQMMDADGNPDDQIVKSVVFSQWTSMLDKIEDALEVAGIRYERLDGTMKRDERTRAMDALKFDPGCEVLLVSLKAGGVGLNLTSAQRVYLMDPYWNPAVENQAVDRIHRLGQTRPVQTVKLIIEGSIEARLLEVQRKKTALANMTLGQTISKADIMARRLDELAQLFDG